MRKELEPGTFVADIEVHKAEVFDTPEEQSRAIRRETRALKKREKKYPILFVRPFVIEDNHEKINQL